MSPPVPRRRNLGAYLALAFCLLSVLIAGALVLLIERNASRRIESGVGANLAELANQMTSRLDRGVFERYREIELLAARFGSMPAGDGMERELGAVRDSYRYYAWVGVADAAGVVRAASGGMLVGADVSARPWFSRALSGSALGDVHEAVLLAKLLPATRGEPLRFFDVAFPLRDAQGTAVGVLGAHVSWEWARDVHAAIFQPMGRERRVEALILSREGVVLLGPEGTQGLQLAPESARRGQRGELGYAVETWSDGKSYLVGFSRMRGYDRSPGLGWTVLVRQELGDAYVDVRELQRQVLASGVAIAVLFSVLGWFIARAITAPLHALAKGARALEAGREAVLPASRAYSEVATLGEALTSLVARLRSNETALRQLNLELEQRVAERTAELQSAFDRVQASEQRIRTIIESAQDPFIGMDLQGRIVEWNSQAESVFGWARSEVQGRLVGEILLPPGNDEALRAAVRHFVDTGRSGVIGRPLERELIDRQGQPIAVEIKVGFVETGNDRFFSAFVHDIRQRKAVERMKDEFVSTVSHELRTPLTAIYGSLSLLHSGMAGELPEEARGLLAISHASTERLIRLVNDLLDVEKIASGKIDYRMQRQPLRPLVEQSLRDTAAYARGFDVTCTFAQGEDLVVDCDADRIVQVCVNLLSNAVKFSPRGGTVDVCAERDAEGGARVSVRGGGPGIPTDFRQRIFERFAQADASDRRAQGGTGLGLSICRSIVQAHGGRIDFDSEPGVVTTFYFVLPVPPAGTLPGAPGDAQNEVR